MTKTYSNVEIVLFVCAAAATVTLASPPSCTGRNGEIGICVTPETCGGSLELSRDCIGRDACCVDIPCYVPGIGNGTCQDVSQCPRGTSFSVNGFCGGPSNIQCCVKNVTMDRHQSAYYQNWCSNWESDPMIYLDDMYCQKVFPSVLDREFRCPIRYSSIPDDYVPAQPNLLTIKVNTSALDGITESNDDFLISVILIRRDSQGIPHFKYISNGKHLNVVQPWSSTKVFAVINAASTLRDNCTNRVGIDSIENAKNDPLGDLVTIIESYDSTQGMQSNCLAYYFHNIGGRVKLNDTLHTWLQAPPSESLGGNYGCSDTYGLGYGYTSVEDDTQFCAINGDFNFPIIPNQLSMLTASEFYKRIVLHRDEPYPYPSIEWADVREYLYGTENSSLFPGIGWGGASTDTAIYLQTGADMTEIEKRSGGQWRIFSKLGAGPQTSGDETVYNSYACFPVVGEDGTFVMDQGVEFVLSAWARDQISFEGSDERMQRNVANVVSRIVDGSLA